jgi:hypothetical protein
MLPPSPRAEPLAPWWPAPGLYAIGATVLQGPYAPELNTYAWFRSREPIAKLGHALFLYRVPPRPAPTWLALCGPENAEDVTARLGQPDLRVIHLDCTQARLYAESGPGLYLAAAELDLVPAASSVLSLRDAQGQTTAALRQVEPPYLPPDLVPAQAAVDGPLSFLGHTVTAAEDDLRLDTYWRVETIPDRPLSLMAHLIAADGTAAVVADGLGVPREQWRPGDLIVQRHDLTSDQEIPTGDYTLLTGAYWLDTMERWDVTGDHATPDEAVHVDTLHLP